MPTHGPDKYHFSSPYEEWAEFLRREVFHFDTKCSTGSTHQYYGMAQGSNFSVVSVEISVDAYKLKSKYQMSME